MKMIYGNMKKRFTADVNSLQMISMMNSRKTLKIEFQHLKMILTKPKTVNFLLL